MKHRPLTGLGGVATLCLLTACGSTTPAGPASTASAPPPAVSITSEPASTPPADEPDVAPSTPTAPTASRPATTTRPSTSPSTSPTSSPTTGPTTGPTRAGAAQPTQPGEYGDAALAAARRGDAAAVARSSTPAIAARLVEAKPPADLLRTACEDDMCSWSNEKGARVTMTFDLDKVGRGANGAITKVTTGS